MKHILSLLLTLFSAIAQAAYPNDIVQYWVDQSALLVNSTIIGGLPSPPSGWFEAITQASIYRAALTSSQQPLAFQQLAVSHAAHNTLQWVFHGTRLYATIDTKLAALLPAIGIHVNSTSYASAASIGRAAATEIIAKREGDHHEDFVPWAPLPKIPGLWQPTPGGQDVPDTPQARFIRLFGGVGDVVRFRAPPPPSVDGAEYEGFVQRVKAVGEANSTNRTEYETDTAYFWRESSPIQWNRLANLVVGDTLKGDVVASAKFYAQLNYALSNAAIASWDSKYYYNGWRPVTAIRRPDVWLLSGHNISSPSWTPLLSPTPNHQDYLSTHATFGGAAAAVIRAWNGGDEVDALLSSNVTLNNRGVITRRIRNLTEAAVENGESRVLGGIHFQFASDVGRVIGDWVARETLDVFDETWDEV